MGIVVTSAVWGLLGTLVGAAASVGTTWISNAHESGLEKQRAKDLRAETSRAFQRQTLIDLQDAVHHLVAQAAFAHMHDAREARAKGEWGITPLADEQAEMLRQAFRKVTILNQRVANDALRARVNKFKSDVGEAVNASNQKDASFLWEYTAEEIESLSSDIGEVLRSNYEQA